MEGLKLRGVVRPAEGREGPERGAEPGVEDVLILLKDNRAVEAVLAPYLLLAAADVDLSVIVVPGGDSVAPPELAGDAPVLDVSHPGEVHVLVLLRDEGDAAVLDCLDCRLGEGLRPYVPLAGEVRLDGHSAPVTVRLHHDVVLDLLEETKLLKFLDDEIARLVAVKPAELLGDVAVIDVRGLAVDVVDLGLVHDPGVLGEDVDHGERVALPDLVIVEVVRRGDLHAAGSLGHVGVLVAHDGDGTVDEREDDLLPDEVVIPRILGVHRDGGIAEHGLRTGGRDDDVVLAVLRCYALLQGIAEVPHVALHLAVLDLKVGDGGAELRIPVDEPLAAVDEVLVIEPDEHLPYGAGEALVHGESLARPVDGVAEAPHLLRDGAA